MEGTHKKFRDILWNILFVHLVFSDRIWWGWRQLPLFPLRRTLLHPHISKMCSRRQPPGAQIPNAYLSRVWERRVCRVECGVHQVKSQWAEVRVSFRWEGKEGSGVRCQKARLKSSTATTNQNNNNTRNLAPLQTSARSPPFPSTRLLDRSRSILIVLPQIFIFYHFWL